MSQSAKTDHEYMEFSTDTGQVVSEAFEHSPLLNLLTIMVSALIILLVFSAYQKLKSLMNRLSYRIRQEG